MQRPQQPIPMYPRLNDETDMQQHHQPQSTHIVHPPRDHEEIPLHNMPFNRSVSETPERVRVRQIFNRVSFLVSIWQKPDCDGRRRRKGDGVNYKNLRDVSVKFNKNVCCAFPNDSRARNCTNSKRNASKKK